MVGGALWCLLPSGFAAAYPAIHFAGHIRDFASLHCHVNSPWSSWESSRNEFPQFRPSSCLAHRTLPRSPVPHRLARATCERRCADAGWIVFLHEKPSAYLLRSGRLSRTDQVVTRSVISQLRRRGAKASSTVSGMSQGRREPLLREFLAALARMSRRNFRG